MTTFGTVTIDIDELLGTDDRPARGYVKFVPSARYLPDVDGQATVIREVIKPLGRDVISVELLAGIVWTAHFERLGADIDPVAFELEDGQTIDIATITPPDSDAVEITVIYNAGQKADQSALEAETTARQNADTAINATLASLPATYVTQETAALDRLRGLYRAQSSQLRRVRANLARAASAQGFARIAFLGDSTVAGYGSTPQTSWPVQLRDALALVGYPAHASGFMPMNTQVADTRWTMNDWIAFAGVTSSAFKSVSTSPAVLVTDKTGTTVRVYYLNSNGPFSVSIDGGGAVTVTPTGANSIGEYSVTGLANTTHTISIARTTSTNCVILGVELLVSGTPTGVRIANVGVAGATAADLDNDTSGDWFGHIRFVRDQWNTDCTFLMCETNDAFAGTNVAAYKASITTIVQGLQQGNRDVVLMTGFPASTVANWVPYTTALYEVAVERNVALIDIQERMGDWTTANIYGQMTDAAHPNRIGYRVAALAVLGLLTS